MAATFENGLAVAGQTSYGTVYLDSSGVLQTVWPGTSGQALVSNGAGAAPTFQAVGTGKPVSQATSVVDVSAAKTIIDANPATTYADTIEPATAQYIYTVQAADLPSNTMVVDYCFVVFLTQQNLSGTNLTVNCRLTRNGTNFGGSIASSLTSTNVWASQVLEYRNGGISAGDTIGVKVWSSAASQAKLAHVCIAIIPRKYLVVTSEIQQMAGSNNLGSAVVAGITGYDIETYYVQDPSWTNLGVSLNAGTVFEKILSGQWYEIGSGGGAMFQAVGTTEQMYQVRIPRYIRKWTLST